MKDERSSLNSGRAGSPANSPSPGFWRPGVAWLVLVLCLAATALGGWLFYSQFQMRRDSRFREHIQKADLAIRERLDSYKHVLKGAAGLFAASRSVERDEWAAYVRSLNVGERYRAIRALGFVANVAPAELRNFEATNRLDGAPGFAVFPAGERALHHVVQFVEPVTGNAAVIGFDAATEDVLRAAADESRSSGDAALAHRVSLLQTEDRLAAAMLLPIFKDAPNPAAGAGPPRRPEGWVFAAFFLDEWMDPLRDGTDAGIDFEIYDSVQMTPGFLLYDADRLPWGASPAGDDELNDRRAIPFGQSAWHLRYRTRPGFDAGADDDFWWMIGGGMGVSLLLFAITLSLSTTRRRALGMAQEMTEKFRIQERAVVASNNGIFITDASDPNNSILYANPAFEKITGYAAAELQGKNTFFLLADDQEQADAAVLRAAFAEGRECRVVVRCYRRNGSMFWNELSLSPVRDEDGIINHFVGIVEDITERERAERALRDSEARLQAILDNSTAVIYVKDLQGRYLLVNRQFENLFHVDRQSVRAKSDLDLFPQEAAEAFRANDRQVIEAGRSLEWEEIAPHDDGPHTYISIKFPLRDAAGKIHAVCGISTDISERKRTETELEQARRLAETASTAKGDFLANMSHEIRTPMNAIMGMTELALGTDLTREQRSYLNTARNSTHYLLSIINDILDFSKIEAGMLELSPERFRLREALATCLKTFGLRAAEKGLELALDVAPGVPDELVGDADRLRQIVNNLVSNAVKFTDKGEIVVSVRIASADTSLVRPDEPPAGSSRRQEAPTTRADGEQSLVTSSATVQGGDLTAARSNGQRGRLLHFCVRDTGVGVPREKQESIFQAFTQADASVTRRHGGTGLGLAIATKLSALMGGRLWLESEPGQGSRFQFTAEFLEPVAGESDTAIALLDLAGRRVLVVDDSATSRHILCEMLTGWKLRPAMATDLDEAKRALDEAARAEPFHLALFDARMPDDAGFILAAEWRRNPRGVGAIIMMLSSVGSADEIRRCRELGIDHYLIKPLGQSDLLNAVLGRLDALVAADSTVSSALAQPGAPLRRLRVLLAEDNAVNREVATTALRKLGHDVLVAASGLEALAVFKHDEIDLVLMDVQMPVMDGLEATSRIRQDEAGSERRVPVIGLTAHAMKGDREKALVAGMDDYLTKPLRLQDLAAMLRKWTPVAAGGGARAVIDEAKLLEALGGDGAAVQRLLNLFLETTPPLLADLREAASAGDADKLFRAAHTLKGSFLQLGDPAAAAIARQIEEVAARKNVTGALPLVEDLGAVFAEMESAWRRKLTPK